MNKIAKNLSPPHHDLNIITWPNEILHKICDTVTTFDDSLSSLIMDMFYTMQKSNGVGLAAPQVGILKNIATIWIEPNNPIVLINPTIIEMSQETFSWQEGCLSVPGFFEERERPDTIKVVFNDIDGTEVMREFHGLYSFAIQHEIDHLQGKLFIDDLPHLTQTKIKHSVHSQYK